MRITFTSEGIIIISINTFNIASFILIFINSGFLEVLKEDMTMIQADYYLFFLGLLWVAGATLCDLRKREVPNWLNFSLVIFALAFRYFYSVFAGFDYFLFGLAGFAFYFVLAYAFYYGRVFAGGDAKLMMGLGAVLPMFGSHLTNLKMMLFFVLTFMIAGSVYGLLYSSVLVVTRARHFGREFLHRLYQGKILFVAALMLAILGAVFAFFVGGIAWLLPLLLILLPFLYIYAKSVEEACMVTPLPVTRLTEGDWLYERIKVKNKVILPRWEGLTKRQLGFLQDNYRGRRVMVKQGIPFVPAFLFAYIIFFWKFVF